jgi:WD40 repeat protein
LASGSADYTIKLWDTATWELASSLRGRDHEIWSLTYNPNDIWIAALLIEHDLPLSTGENSLRLPAIVSGQHYRPLVACLVDSYGLWLKENKPPLNGL